MEFHSKELQSVEVVGKIQRSFRCVFLLPVGDTVDPEDYDNAIENSRSFKPAFLRLAMNDEERKLFNKI